MKPQSIGRALGIGLRVAGRIAGQRMAAGSGNTVSEAGPAQKTSSQNSSLLQSRTAGQAAGKVTRGVAHGVRGFLRPFSRVGGILWLEVTGVFFALFALVFGLAMWRTRPGSVHGPYDKPFLTSLTLLAIFLYLSVSSFVRAGKK
jgi:hypothetical protein